jgi:hypothetical protein
MSHMVYFVKLHIILMVNNGHLHADVLINYWVILKGKPSSRWNSSENKFSISSPNTKKKKTSQGCGKRQWHFLKFLNLLGYGDNEIKIREYMPRKTSTKSLEPDASVYCLRYTRLYSPSPWHDSLQWARASSLSRHLSRHLDYTQTHHNR